MEMVVKIAEIKCPKNKGWRIVWIFSYHGAMAEDPLDVTKMNVKPGGMQHVMSDGFWNGKPLPMNRNGVT